MIPNVYPNSIRRHLNQSIHKLLMPNLWRIFLVLVCPTKGYLVMFDKGEDGIAILTKSYQLVHEGPKLNKPLEISFDDER